MRRLILLCCLLLPVQLIGGCADSNSDAPPAGEVHPTSWVDPRLAGSNSFHADGGTSGDFSDCKICHGIGLAGSGGIPGCFDCHFDLTGARVPPGSGWNHGFLQHEDQIAFFTVCNRCHDTHRQFELPPAACHDCHHASGQAWLDSASAEFHGASLLNCSVCHNQNVTCFQCHFGSSGSRSPAGSGWTHAVGDHEDLESSGSVCNRCHGLTRSFRGEPGGCHDCH